MNSWGSGRRRTWGLRIVIAVLTVAFLIPAPTPALALNTNLAIGCTILGVLATPLIAYGIWENLPQNQGKERLLKGEFYVGGYMGGVFTPSQTLNYNEGIRLNNGTTQSREGSVTLNGNNFRPGVVGGFKFGYFCNRVPYVGLEVETSVDKSSRRPNESASANRPIQGFTKVSLHNDNWINWTTALHIVGRYGFMKDQDVPFGRLQPYLGVGPAFVVNYEEIDSAKNFGIDMMAGVRYMMLKNVSAFVEYKFTHIWNAEFEDHYFFLPNSTVVRGTATMDYTSHKWVLGVAYHF
jgi:opacity protein-like surface antigen